MTADTGWLQQILDGGDPIAVVFYPDEAAREALLELCELLTERPCARSCEVETAFGAEHREQVLLLTPADEVAAVQVLEGRREALGGRTGPVVLFLLQGGAAASELFQRAPHLVSWLRGADYDAEPSIDADELEERRQRFQARHGQSPDAWLEAWWGGDALPDDLENNFEAQEAWLLRRT